MAHQLNSEIHTFYRTTRPGAGYSMLTYMIGRSAEEQEAVMRDELAAGKYESVVKVVERVTWRGMNGRRHREILSETPLTTEAVTAS